MFIIQLKYYDEIIRGFSYTFRFSTHKIKIYLKVYRDEKGGC